jgi:hypothetical protein
MQEDEVCIHAALKEATSNNAEGAWKLEQNFQDNYDALAL